LAQEAEGRSVALARDEAEARQKAEKARQDTAQALKYITAGSIAATFGQVSGGTTLLARVGKHPEVVRSLGRACSLGEQLLADNPHARLLLSLTEQYAELAVFQAAVGQRPEAVRSCRRGLELLDRLDWEERKALGDHKDLGVTCFLIGAVLMILERHDEAAPAFEQAVRHQRAVLEESPGDRKLRKVLSVSYFHLAYVQRQAGRLAESAATSLARRKLWPDDADEVHDVACELALCAARVPASREEERRRYCDQAVDVLRQAVALGLKDPADVRRNPDFKLLRGRDDFQKLVKEMEDRERRK
jgi:tetratricopeptide (TPR) repeat protein